MPASAAPDLVASFSPFDISAMPKGDVYKLLTALVVPRPIAWVTSQDAEGHINAAPFSFFNILSSDPPLIAVAFAAAPDRTEKDSLHNIQQSGEFVVNMVSEGVAEAMNTTATNAPRGMDETRLAGLTLAPSTRVTVPSIAESPAGLECVVWQVIPTGGSTTIVLARVVFAHVTTEAFDDLERLHVDAGRLQLIGRMHGGDSGGYATTRNLFNMQRKSWPPEK